ncbi:hypothetical protein BWD42_23040 [Sphingobacterium sp. CZ-UAM]|uniref:hypothetical protein n=1 Tax=Sphingobacterium sp. CZ-UAM TaxID=1933868 RepID=UPI000984B907|nr:hypothetical protein [Sphingobacterium sp. CZ-UAM]OOG15992.1 hypothetical protein BWD42_23040 [Sphingobacterium sp. CZ-UAM]
MKSLFLAILLFTLYGCGNSQNQSKPSDKSENKEQLISPYFGFLNHQKDSLIALPMDQAMENPEKYNYVIIENQVSPLEFIQNKTDNKESNGRQTAQNFANSEGSLFTIKNEIKSGDFGMLVNQAFINQYKVEPFTKVHRETSTEVREKLEKKYNRKISKSTTVAVLKDKAEFNLTVFENQQDSALAVFSYTKEDQLINLDFPTTYDDISTWRVDDGGQFDNEAFQILTVLRSEVGISFVSIFGGAEGYELNFYQPKKDKFSSTAQAYGYSSPL